MSLETESSRWQTPGGRTDQCDLRTEGEWSEPEDSLTPRREQAIERIKTQKMHRFHVFFVLYLIVNTLLIATWVLCAALGWSGYFPWYLPIITIVLWGLLVVRVRARAYEVNAYPEEQIQRELQKRP